MRRLSKIIMATGGIISMLAMCCLDSDGIYMYYAGAVCILGGFIAGAGYGLRALSERRREMQIEMFYFHQADKLDGDMVLIDCSDSTKQLSFQQMIPVMTCLKHTTAFSQSAGGVFTGERAQRRGLCGREWRIWWKKRTDS